MAFHRRVVVRIVAGVLAIALSTQVVSAQVASCMAMDGPASNSDHTAMTAHSHSSPDAVASPAKLHNDSHRQSPGTSGCTQTVLCANAPAIPVTTVSDVSVDHTTRVISFVALAIQARAFPPDSPPPRI
jgi:hypothetical protein